MIVQILAVPYDSAHRGVRMGAGPERLLAAGLVRHLEDRGHQIRCTVIEAPAESWRAEIQTGFQLMHAVAGAVREAREQGRFPLVLSGNCSTAVGTLAGLGTRDTGVLWFDAHGDFNTPETTIGGFLDGMALATVTGRCWTELAWGVPGFRPVAERRVALLGARDLDPIEAGALARSEVSLLPPATVAADLPRCLETLTHRTEQVYLHVDLDVLDPEAARANAYAAPGGLTLEQLELAVTTAGRAVAIAAATISAYDPALDPDGRTFAAAFRVAAALLAAAEGAQAPGHLRR
ncbi:MAG: arginase family protein [Gemmatimonadales bacterium]